VSASNPAFGQALIAAAEFSLFEPPVKDGHAVKMTLHRSYHFELPSEAAETGESGEIRVERELRAGQAFKSAKGLDHPLRPVWQIIPRVPLSEVAKGNKNGKAEIEVVIDEEGRFRAPKIVSASNDAFGYAAATAVSQWCFDPPMRNGEATQVRAIIPLVFK